MKPQPVPTAPRFRAQQPPKRIAWLVLTVVLSLAAGSVSALFTITMSTQWPSVARWLNLTNNDVVVIPAAEDTSSGTLVRALTDRQLNAIVHVTVNQVDRGLALIVSNDGWLITPSSNVPAATSVIVTLSNNKAVESDQIIVDDYAGLTYFHIPKTNLPIIDLRTTKAVLGDTVVVLQPLIDQRPVVAITYLESIAEPISTIFSTKQNNLVYTSDRVLTNVQIGAPVYDYHAQVLGLMTSERTILPVAAFNDRLQQILSQQTLATPKLDLTYTLSAQGAEVITSNVPEILPGDIITTVANHLVNAEKDLAWELQTNNATVLTFTILRSGTKKTIEIDTSRLNQ